MTPEGLESALLGTIEWVRLGVELTGAAVLAVGVLRAVLALLGGVVRRTSGDFAAVRLQLARFLILALEFQLAADILGSAFAPSWDRIGKLGAIAVIRTMLNYFLTRELREAGPVPEAGRA
jgi:uncharacterized membrane protein